MRILFLLTALLLIMLLSCKKEINCSTPQYIPPLISDSIFKRAYSFTYNYWKDSAVVSHTDSSLLFEIIGQSQERNRAAFKKLHADQDAIKADSAIFYDQRHRSEIVSNVKMYFTYMLTNIVNRKDTFFSYTYPLTDTIFNHY